jgi:heptosyltransferase-1
MRSFKRQRIEREDRAEHFVFMRILIVKLSSLGDVIQTMAVLPDVLEVFPDAQIDWVVEEAFAPLVQLAQGVRCVIPIGQRRWRKSYFSAATRTERRLFHARLRQDAYDVVIDFQGLIKSAWVGRAARLAAGGFSATYANGSDACSYEWPVRYLLQRSVPMPQRMHAVARYRLLAAQALGYNHLPLLQMPARYGWHLGIPPQAAPGLPEVVLAHGTTRTDNEWPDDHWLALARQLIAGGFSVGLPHAGPRELVRVQMLAQRLGPAACVWPALSLDALARRMATSTGVIGVDSGLSHLAVALDLPHVQIFSQDRAWRAGPAGRTHQVAVGGAQAPDVAQVWDSWQAVLAASATGASRS